MITSRISRVFSSPGAFVLRTRAWSVGQESAGSNFGWLHYQLPEDASGDLAVEVVASMGGNPALGAGDGCGLSVFFQSFDDQSLEEVTQVEGETAVYVYAAPPLQYGEGQTGYDILDASPTTYSFTVPQGINFGGVLVGGEPSPYGGGFLGEGASFLIDSHSWSAGQTISIYFICNARPLSGSNVWMDIHSVSVNGVEVPFGADPDDPTQSISGWNFTGEVSPAYVRMNTSPIGPSAHPGLYLAASS